MANLKAIRRRIGSVKSTQKITRAMKMVAAARLRRAQASAENFRPYADLTTSVLAEVAGGAKDSDHPLLQRRTPKKTVILVLSSDRGLCGGFNSNLCRATHEKIKLIVDDDKPHVSIIGRKAVDFFNRQDVEIHKIYTNVYDGDTYSEATRIAKELAHLYETGEVDRIELAYNEFVSMMSQKPRFKQLLPVEIPEQKEVGGGDRIQPAGFIFEPDREALLEKLIPRYVEVQVYRALLESVAAEHAARMTAMDGATNNATEMIDHLTLVYNRARQSAITSELIEIVSGAEALNE